MADSRVPNRVRERWLSQSAAICGWMTSSCPLVAETLAATGLDAVVVDMQHSATTLDAVTRLAAVIELRGAEPFVRIPSLDCALIGQLLDLGITGIIVPLVESPQAAAAIVAASRYPPEGSRSFGPRRSKLRFGKDYLSRASETIVTLAMVETMRGLEALEQIAGVAGLDGVFVGPADLAVGLGAPPTAAEPAGDVEHAIAGIRRRTSSLGSRAGIFAASAELAVQRLAQGFDLVTATSDLTAIQDRAAADATLLMPMAASGSRLTRGN